MLLDNFDSFTYNLVDYFGRLGIHCQVYRNNEPFEEIVSKKYQGLVLSPGPGTPRQAGQMVQLIDWYKHELPMLGICLGHQALGEFFGATLTKAHRPMHGKLSSIQVKNTGIFKGLPSNFNVVRYHSLLIDNLPDCLETLAYTQDDFKEVMAFRHKDFPMYGVQFHPEAALTEFGLEILKNWLIINKIEIKQ